MNAATQMPQVGYFRNMSEIESHLATGWKAEALCGARPTMRDIGWMFGADNAVYSGITSVCPDCQGANREIAESFSR
jgi:hypothetical protein